MFNWVLNVPLIGGDVNWGAGRLQVHGLYKRRLVYREVVEARWYYKKSYLRWFRNTACADLTGSSRIKKTKLVYLLNLSESRGSGGRSVI